VVSAPAGHPRWPRPPGGGVATALKSEIVGRSNIFHHHRLASISKGRKILASCQILPLLSPSEQPPHVGYTLLRHFFLPYCLCPTSVYTGQDVFKNQINLTEYATAQGYRIDRKASSRNSARMHNDIGRPCFSSIFDNDMYRNNVIMLHVLLNELPMVRASATGVLGAAEQKT
jgi:hypothetical protein